MIDEVLIFLRDHLNTALDAGESGADKVVFIDGANMDPIALQLGAVTVLLINVEEERTLRDADLYSQVDDNGARLRAQPTIGMNLYVLFVARFKRYEQGLAYLSRIIRHFQSHRVLTPRVAPQLSDRIGRLTMELTTLPFSEQDAVWNALRMTYHPSVLYRVKLVVFHDQDAMPVPEIKEQIVRTTA